MYGYGWLATSAHRSPGGGGYRVFCSRAPDTAAVVALVVDCSFRRDVCFRQSSAIVVHAKTSRSIFATLKSVAASQTYLCPVFLYSNVPPLPY